MGDWKGKKVIKQHQTTGLKTKYAQKNKEAKKYFRSCSKTTEPHIETIGLSLFIIIEGRESVRGKVGKGRGHNSAEVRLFL